jgi:hypothetical protein
MAEPTIKEASTYPGVSWIDDFFSDKPTDLRYVKTTYKKINNSTPMDKSASSYSFRLKPLHSPICYLLQDTYLNVNMKIVKASDGSLPAVVAGKSVGPVNSAVTSLFKQLTTTINSAIVETTDNYTYQCYFQDLLSFDEQKKSTLESAGVALDGGDTNKTDTSEANSGFLLRAAWLKEDFVAGELFEVLV